MSIIIQLVALALIAYAWVSRKLPPKRNSMLAAAALSIVLWTSSFYVQKVADEEASSLIIERTDRQFKLYGQCIAEQGQKLFPGDKSVLVILPPLDDHNRIRLTTIEEGLRNTYGSAAKLKFIPIVNPNVSSSGKNLQWSDLKQVIRSEDSAQTIIFLCPLPVNENPEDVSAGLRDMKGGRASPVHFIGTWAYVDPMAQPLEEETMNALVLIGTRDSSVAIPADDQAAIAKRFIVLHKDNLEEMNKKFPELNIYDPPAQP